eukprot:3242280-Rhodomonas_salina.2
MCVSTHTDLLSLWCPSRGDLTRLWLLASLMLLAPGMLAVLCPLVLRTTSTFYYLTGLPPADRHGHSPSPTAMRRII